MTPSRPPDEPPEGGSLVCQAVEQSTGDPVRKRSGVEIPPHGVHLADQTGSIRGRVFEPIRQPPARHADVAHRLGFYLWLEQREKPQRFIAGVDQKRKSLQADEHVVKPAPRGDRIEPQSRHNEHQMGTTRSLGPTKTRKGGQILGCEILECLGGNKRAEGVANDRYGLLRLNLPKKPGQVVAVGVGPLVLESVILQQHALLLARPGKHDHAGKRAAGAAGREPLGQPHAL